ncbi:MAG: hypothetical protein ACJASQ_003099 [Crocinitomicaceae bacterium]|jgi:hypothetical protein
MMHSKPKQYITFLVCFLLIGFTLKAHTSELNALDQSNVIELNLNQSGLKTQFRKKFRQNESHSVAIDDTIVYQLSATLSVVTIPIGDAKNNASVFIYDGSMLLYTTTLTQAAPFLKYDSEIILGSSKIEKGMELTLQIPSSLQYGTLTMNAIFSTLNVPATAINSLVASWKL